MLSSHLLPLAAPAVLLVVACLALYEPGRRPRYLPALAEAAALLALVITAFAAVLLVAKGPGDAVLMVGRIGLSVRLDALSSVMLLLIAFLGWVVLRYARSYMDGEARQGAFTGWLCVILATVLLLVQSGNVWQLVFAWIATSLVLQKLLLFYPERVQAQRAARKRQIITRLGDLALIGAAALLTSSAGTSEISAIAEIARADEVPGGMMTAGGLLALAAVLMSAQFPTQGWLTEVMETPTPVSALLHAGIINAGGFLLIRFADVMLTVPGVLAGLVMVGGFSALLGGLVMLTQPAVKTSLAWSTVAQMGFMLLQCGLALFSLALLHIVAHSLYKAHSFLFSGEAVERVNSIRRPGPVAIPNVRAVAEAFGLALIIYTLVAALFGGEKSVQALALGAILIFGVAYLLAQGFPYGRITQPSPGCGSISPTVSTPMPGSITSSKAGQSPPPAAKLFGNFAHDSQYDDRPAAQASSKPGH